MTTIWLLLVWIQQAICGSVISRVRLISRFKRLERWLRTMAGSGISSSLAYVASRTASTWRLLVFSIVHYYSVEQCSSQTRTRSWGTNTELPAVHGHGLLRTSTSNCLWDSNRLNLTDFALSWIKFSNDYNSHVYLVLSSEMNTEFATTVCLFGSSGWWPVVILVVL